MSAISVVEIRIIRDLIRRRERRSPCSAAEKMIAGIAIFAALGMLILFLPAGFWLLALVAVTISLGI